MFEYTLVNGETAVLIITTTDKVHTMYKHKFQFRDIFPRKCGISR